MKKKILCLTFIYSLLFGCTQQVDNEDVSIITGTILIQNQDKYVIYHDENTNLAVQKKISDDVLIMDSSSTYTFDALTDGEQVLLSMIHNKIKVIQINYE